MNTLHYGLLMIQETVIESEGLWWHHGDDVIPHQKLLLCLWIFGTEG
jgi:hypothetical protein